MSTDEQSLTAKKITTLPSDEDVAFYREHGWYVSKKVLPEEVIDRALRGAERFYRGEYDGTLPLGGGFKDWQPSASEALRNNEFVSLRNREIAALVHQPIVGAIAARLAGTASIRLLDDQLVYKPPGDRVGNTTVGWHADHAYWGTCSSDDLLTAWIPFHDVDETRGPLIIIDGSHRWDNLEHTRFFNETDLETVEARFEREGRALKKVPITLQKGQISFHHCWTVHASLPNLADKIRVALAVHLQDEKNAYRPAFAPDGREVHIADERLCRRLPNGDPDFHDPVVFPVLWPPGPNAGQLP